MNNEEITPEQLETVRDKYSVSDSEREIATKYGATQTLVATTTTSLSILKWLGWLAILVMGIGLIVVFNTESLLTITIWGGLIGPSFLAAVLAFVAYFATKALIISRR